MTLDKNPDNYHAQVEQLAFSPSNRVRGIEFSPDKVLQARIFAYPDTHRHRIGTNFYLVPVNQPLAPTLYPTIRDGPMNTSTNEGNMPNYYPCSFMPGVYANTRNNETRTHLQATDVDRFVSDEEDNYTQVRDLFLSYSNDERNRLYTNIVSELQYAYDFIQERALGHFEKIHSDYADGVRQALQTAKRMNSK